ncbi:MAG: amylo-alpha-1,6-glucosidase, partial [Gammaproteobacteria bacterium]
SFARAEPGKIFHEIRPGSEAAAMQENPFAGYYGGSDTTALFPILAKQYYDRSEDSEFLYQIWPNLQRALEWVVDNMERHGGYVRYRYDPEGLVHQGWKDSGSCIFHANAPEELPPDPIALCEIQAYAYGALNAGGFFYSLFGDPQKSADYCARARDLFKRFNLDFWLEDLATYAIALDGYDRQCRLQSSNAGHAFLTGLVPHERAQALADTLLHPSSFSGFGIRTLSDGPGYDPLSYHRGSIWPHDNALIAKGMAEYGLMREIEEILMGLLHATADNPRLPELFSGAERVPGAPKEPYLSACSPQAWAAAAPLGIISAWEKASGQSRDTCGRIFLPNGLGAVATKLR